MISISEVLRITVKTLTMFTNVKYTSTIIDYGIIGTPTEAAR